MISASHNPIEDNGIKFFGADGFKLSDAVEDEIGDRLNDRVAAASDRMRGIGVATHRARSGRPLLDEAGRSAAPICTAGRSSSTLRSARRIASVRRCSNGSARASSRSTPKTTAARINVGCGATDLTMLQRRVRAEIARGSERVVGVAFDGDADRAQVRRRDGRAARRRSRAADPGARPSRSAARCPATRSSATVMSNVGLERALERAGIGLLRAPVGDRYVLEAMRAGGYRLGGEQSGHVIDLDRNTTGDGLDDRGDAVRRSPRARGTRLHDLAAELTVFPQILINVRVEDRAVAGDPAVLAAVAAAERPARVRRTDPGAPVGDRTAGPGDGRGGRRGHDDRASPSAVAGVIRAAAGNRAEILTFPPFGRRRTPKPEARLPRLQWASNPTWYLCLR